MHNDIEISLPNYELIIARTIFFIAFLIVTLGVGLGVYTITDTYYWALGFAFISWKYWVLLGADKLENIAFKIVNRKFVWNLNFKKQLIFVRSTEVVLHIGGAILFSAYFCGITYLFFNILQKILHFLIG